MKTCVIVSYETLPIRLMCALALLAVGSYDEPEPSLSTSSTADSIRSSDSRHQNISGTLVNSQSSSTATIASDAAAADVGDDD